MVKLRVAFSFFLVLSQSSVSDVSLGLASGEFPLILSLPQWQEIFNDLGSRCFSSSLPLLGFCCFGLFVFNLLSLSTKDCCSFPSDLSLLFSKRNRGYGHEKGFALFLQLLLFASCRLASTIPFFLMNDWWGLWRRICELKFPQCLWLQWLPYRSWPSLSLSNLLLIFEFLLISSSELLSGPISTVVKKRLHSVSPWRCLFTYVWGYFGALGPQLCDEKHWFRKTLIIQIMCHFLLRGWSNTLFI